jgi:DNA-directed RNA polymerase alpha subunit
LEVETDGSITPEQAFDRASDILCQHFTLFGGAFPEKDQSKKKESAKKEKKAKKTKSTAKKTKKKKTSSASRKKKS